MTSLKTVSLYSPYSLPLLVAFPLRLAVLIGAAVTVALIYAVVIHTIRTEDDPRVTVRLKT